MRIIGGKYRGKKLFSPLSKDVRPTSDKAREALFNILRSRLGSDFGALKLIDVFSGSGAFGLEAVSQGFGKVLLLDQSTKDLEKNVKLFGAEREKIQLIQADATKDFFCTEKFDVLFMDAPYHKGLTDKALVKCAAVLREGALCLIETAKDETLVLPPAYCLLDERRYGLAKILVARFSLQIP